LLQLKTRLEQEEFPSAKLIHLLVDLNCINKHYSKRHKINYKMKKIFMPTVFIILYSSIINHGIAIMPLTIPNDHHQIDLSGASLMPVIYAAGLIQRSSSGETLLPLVFPVSEESNITTTKNMEGNITISDQYIITLKDNVSRTPESLQNALDNLTSKVHSEGAKVIYVYKQAIKGLAIKVPDQRTLAQLLKDLRNDPKVAAIEPDKTMHAFKAGMQQKPVF
jgi:Peptidase inhibitor I9